MAQGRIGVFDHEPASARRVLGALPPVDLEQTLWRAFDDVEDGLAEGCDQPAGKVRPNTLGSCRSQDSGGCPRSRTGYHLQKAGAELQPVLAILLPLPARLDALAGMDLGGGPQHRHEVLVAAHVNAQDAKAGLGAMERDALDKPRQRLSTSFIVWCRSGHVVELDCLRHRLVACLRCIASMLRSSTPPITSPTYHRQPPSRA